jgi:hypothetical protein
MPTGAKAHRLGFAARTLLLSVAASNSYGGNEMDWGFLSFLAEPWFVIPWYVIGIAGFFLVMYDIRNHNTPLKVAMKWAWPIIVLFFSVIGLALYYGTARVPGIAKKPDEEAKNKAHMEYEKNMFRRVNGAVIHCVAGDGLGIMTAMVIARAVEMSFWQEFWFEYLVGFLFGWFIFQFRSMLMMTDSKPMALAMAFRAEFMSMLTVMAGMGAVMGYITPLAVTEQPKPLTFAFWGFGMFGLLLGYVFTWPMNWMMVKIGWKHGMGGMKAGKMHQVKSSGGRYGLLASMSVLGIAALIFPAWLVEVRDGTPLHPKEASDRPSVASGSSNLYSGLRESIQAGVSYLEQDQRSRAAHAIDAAHKASMVANKTASGSGFNSVLHSVERARHAIHMGDEQGAKEKLTAALQHVPDVLQPSTSSAGSLEPFVGATVLNAHGVKVGEVVEVQAGTATVALGGARDVWGFWDLGEERRAQVPADALATGPSQLIGQSMVAIGQVDELDAPMISRSR